MDVTDVRIRRIMTGGKLKAVASVTFDDVFVVHDIKIIQGSSGLFVAMPAKRTPGGELRDIAHPLVTHLRNEIASRVLEAFAALPEPADTGSAQAAAT